MTVRRPKRLAPRLGPAAESALRFIEAVTAADG